LFEHNAFTEHEKNERPHKKTRKFDNQTFKLYHEEIMTKTGADALAEHLRNHGYLVRVLKEPGNHSEWLIYYRRK
jgi:hypothetical protein